jgi:2-polyprenyl-3-methyl-5-hydroxy-6-metoxy-1,4-benzoquinol methylase
MSAELKKFFIEKNIKTILDIGCGDFIWMNLLLNKYNDYDKYLGLDIVDELIKNNNLKYSNSKISFKTFDLVKDEIPKGFDIILIRDVFIHLKNDQIVNFLNLIKNLDIKFFGVTST